MENFYKIDKKKIFLKVYINPKAKKNEIVGIFNGYLKIKISSPPVEGKANKTLLQFLSKLFNIPKSKIKIAKGEKSKEKIIEIENFTEEISEKLKEVANANL